MRARGVALFAQRRRLLTAYRFLRDIMRFSATAIDDLANERISASVTLTTIYEVIAM